MNAAVSGARYGSHHDHDHQHVDYYDCNKRFIVIIIIITNSAGPQ
jgi:Uri superfamily endonuclease